MTLRRCVLTLWATVHLLQLHHSDGERVGILPCAFSSRSRFGYASLGGSRAFSRTLCPDLCWENTWNYSAGYLRDQQGSLQPWGTWFPLTWMRAGGRWLQVRDGVIYQHISHYLKTSPCRSLKLSRQCVKFCCTVCCNNNHHSLSTIITFSLSLECLKTAIWHYVYSYNEKKAWNNLVLSCMDFKIKIELFWGFFYFPTN